MLKIVLAGALVLLAGMAGMADTAVAPGRPRITPKQLAQLLSVPLGTIHRLSAPSAEDPIPCVRVGRQLRYDLDEVEAWLAKRKRGGDDDSRRAFEQ